MDSSTLISVEQLEPMVGDPRLVLVDCRFDLGDPPSGYAQYVSGHIPGAVYANLDGDLSGPVAPGRTGRHPLPAPEVLARILGGWGITDGIDVVAYDNSGGAIAARLWWLLKWLGHDSVAVLDGGFSWWNQRERPITPGEETSVIREFVPRPRPELVAGADEILDAVGGQEMTLLDARSRERFAGVSEPIDVRAGRIPGAKSLPFRSLLTDDGRFLDRDRLQSILQPILGDAVSNATVAYCGSGVTAAHICLAAVHAGYEMPRLYPGSWSEWITDPTRPVEVD